MELQKKAAYADKTHDNVEAEDAALSRAIAEGLQEEPVSIEEAKKYMLSIEYEPLPGHAPPPHPTDPPSP